MKKILILVFWAIISIGYSYAQSTTEISTGIKKVDGLYIEGKSQYGAFGSTTTFYNEPYVILKIFIDGKDYEGSTTRGVYPDQSSAVYDRGKLLGYKHWTGVAIMDFSIALPSGQHVSGKLRINFDIPVSSSDKIFFESLRVSPAPI